MKVSRKPISTGFTLDKQLRARAIHRDNPCPQIFHDSFLLVLQSWRRHAGQSVAAPGVWPVDAYQPPPEFYFTHFVKFRLMRINAVPRKPGDFCVEMQNRYETGSDGNMPYASNEDLPVPVKRHLPQYAQQLYRKAFNSAWRHYPLDSRREEISHRVAWTAVKRAYHKAEGKWVPIDPYEPAGQDLYSTPHRN